MRVCVCACAPGNGSGAHFPIVAGKAKNRGKGKVKQPGDLGSSKQVPKIGMHTHEWDLEADIQGLCHGATVV